MAKKKRNRLDVEMVERGLAETRSKARALIMSGAVAVDGRPVDKAGHQVTTESVIEVEGTKLPYVSRGGLKLEKALDRFSISVEGRVCMDVGASTGGFTDCMLQRGARQVLAIDVGYGQLDWRLRNDPRVLNMERTNVRYLTRADLPEGLLALPSLAAIDVSFISLKTVVPAVIPLLAQEAELVALIKPQFEAGPNRVGKGGVVRDPAVIQEVIEDLGNFFSERLMIKIKGITESPIKGAKGNREFLCHLVPSGRRE